jgi:SAM-dependent methyltransferase
MTLVIERTAVINSVASRVRNWMKNLIYPGLDLHTRNRASLATFWKTGSRDVLDAGSGNGYFSWLAYQSGARVLALNFNADQVEKAREFFFRYKKVDQTRLEFRHFNLYNLASLSGPFDEIICYETLEHVRGDREIVSQFFRLLRRGGVLHLCCPYSMHPHHAASELDLEEQGGHVRAGYTKETYEQLLAPVGFEIDKVVGIGSPALCRADEVVRGIRHRLGDAFALPFLPLSLPIVASSAFNPDVPFSLYVRAVKPADGNEVKTR